jgi:hypothetical protein
MLHWPLLDADLYVPGRSASKAKASRANGKRGGRPKDRAAA